MLDPKQAAEEMENAVDGVIAKEANSDPISGEPGAHPIGTIAGAAGGATAGAAVGTAFAGPVGFVAGGIAGAVIGGLAGKGAAEAVNPTDEAAYWRDNFKTRAYVRPDSTYDAYAPAYQFGWESYVEGKGRTWEEIEPDLRRDWEKNNGQSTLPWDEAGSAVRDAWERLARR